MSSLGIEWGAKYTLVGPDGTTVVFNDSSDPNFIDVLSPESSGLDSPDVREDATDATEEDGGHHGDFFEGRRPVVLQGTIIASSATQRNERVGKLKRATRALRRDATLKWKPAGATEEVELKLRRQQPLRVTKGYVKDFQVGMVAADIFPKGTTAHTKPFTFNTSFVTSSNVRPLAISVIYIYWASGKNIKRAKLDGTESVTLIAETPNAPQAIAVDSTYIYFSNVAQIYRAKLDGTGSEFMFTAAATEVHDIVVDANYIYWVNNNTKSIGRAKINGTSVEKEWITPENAETPYGIAVDATYIYWTANTTGKISRAKLDGTEITKGFIDTSALGSYYVAVNAQYIFWRSSNYVGRAKINGTGADPEYITTTETGAGSLRASAEFIYWQNITTKKISVAQLMAELENAGDHGAYPIVKIYGPGSTFKLENATTEESILLEGVELKEGEYFEIDFKNHTILKNGTTYAYNALVFASSQWWALEPGKNKIITTGGTAEFTWQDTFV